jgi:flagellar hook-associated protein 1 FlgK
MSRIWSMMDVGRRSLANSQTALQTTAHNISNKDTEGYSRQRVDMTTNEPIGEGRLRIGMGARALQVNRTNNGFLEKQLEREGNQLGYSNAKSEMLGRVEQVYNEQSADGLSHSLGNFFSAMREFSNNPESLATRTQVKESANYLAKDFNNVKTQLKAVQADADFRVATKVQEVNQLTREIASLNEKVQSVELTGSPANDERDRRDLLIKQLSEKVNIRYAESKDGQLTITAGNTAVLVSGFSSRELQALSTPGHEGKSEGNLEVFYKSTENSTPVNVTKQLTGGELGGLLEVRDNVVNSYSRSMDEMAYSVGWNMNRAHVDGFDRYGKNGNLLFTMSDTVEGAAETMAVNKDIIEDVGKLAAAAQPNAPGDNRVANVMSNLQYERLMNNGSSTIDDYYDSMVGKIGIETQRANSAQQSQEDVVGQLKNIRESISGVSLDEETTKIIEFQKSFDASARLVRTADEMMDTILNLKRL